MHFHTLEMLVMVMIFVHADLLKLKSVCKCAEEGSYQCQNVNNPNVKGNGGTTRKACITGDLYAGISADVVGKGGLTDSHPRTDNAAHSQIMGCSSAPCPCDESLSDEIVEDASNLVRKSYQQNVEHSSCRIAARGDSPNNEEKLNVSDQPVCTRIGVEKECDQDNEENNDENAYWFGSYISSAIQNGCRTVSSIVEEVFSMFQGCRLWIDPSDERNEEFIDEAIDNMSESGNGTDNELKKAGKLLARTCKCFIREFFWCTIGLCDKISGVIGKKKVKYRDANIGSDKNKDTYSNLERTCICEAYIKRAACRHGSGLKGEKGKAVEHVSDSIYCEFMRAFEQEKHGLTMQELIERVASRGEHRGTQIIDSKKCFNGCDEVQDVTKRSNFYETVELAVKMVSLMGVLLFMVALVATVLHHWTK